MIDRSGIRLVRKSTQQDSSRYQRWVKYLTDSKLTEAQIHERATRLTEQGRDPNF